MDGISDVVNSKDGDSSIARTNRSSHPEMPVKVVVNALLKININKVVCHPSTSSLVIFLWCWQTNSDHKKITG